MDALESFLSAQTTEQPQKSNYNTDTPKTFGDQLKVDEEEIFYANKSWNKFNRTMQNRYYENMAIKSMNKQNSNSLSNRIQSYKYKKSNDHNNSNPLETKIHSTPLSRKAKYRKTLENDNKNKFESIDPRFSNNLSESNESGWKLRKAYKFLDDMIDRDINIIKDDIKKNKKDIKSIKKISKANELNYDDNKYYEIKKKGVAINTLKDELKMLKNRRNQIKEKDIEQASKSQMRKMEIEQVRKGIKTPYHHKLERTRFGKVKWVKNDGKNNNHQNVNIQNVYLENKYNQLKKDGKLEKYMKKKTKKMNSKFRAALKKKSGAGWNDTV